MKKSQLRRKSPFRAKRPPERVTSRSGLLWRNGAPIPLPEADTVARAHGYRCAERMVEALRDGTEWKPRKPLRKVSQRRAKENVIYEAAVKEWWAGHDHRCEMRLGNLSDDVHYPRYMPDSRRCPNRANPRPHHLKKRGKFLCDKSTFMALCDSCHVGWLHNNEEEARRLGYLTDRKPKPLT